ncbi:MAG: hypothetical protein JSS81_05570 [Acidobacteria bacterium]|nr:hypothetical protein [Acidobacteriota bacterium]
MNGIERRLRFLEIYAVVSLLVIGVLALSGFTRTTEKFAEIDVERLNVREKNGQLVMVAANSERMPDPVIDGRTWKTERPAGMLFYNGLGDEDGGLVFGAVEGGGKYGAYHGLSFDKFKQAQALALVYNDHSGRYRAGLQIWDRPETPLSDLLARREEIDRLPDGEAKTTALKKLDADNPSPTRVYVGKNDARESEVTLSDDRGRPRLRMIVGADGTPRLDFLDAGGRVVYSLPDDASKKRK